MAELDAWKVDPFGTIESKIWWGDEKEIEGREVEQPDYLEKEDLLYQKWGLFCLLPNIADWLFARLGNSKSQTHLKDHRETKLKGEDLLSLLCLACNDAEDKRRECR